MSCRASQKLWLLLIPYLGFGFLTEDVPKQMGLTALVQCQLGLFFGALFGCINVATTMLLQPCC